MGICLLIVTWKLIRVWLWFQLIYAAELKSNRKEGVAGSDGGNEQGKGVSTCMCVVARPLVEKPVH